MSAFQKENSVLLQDLHSVAYDASIPWRELKNKTILITGATGLIGGLLVKAILYANHAHENGTRVIAVVRCSKKAAQVFSAYAHCDELIFLESDILKSLSIDEPIDYIFHAASVTQSKLFVQTPVDVIRTTIWSSDNLLDLAFKKKVTSMVYISTMEVYGSLNEKEKISEEDFGYLNPLTARSSYPESKQAAESLCYAYFSQHEVPVKTARLTLTFGPGISMQDNRVFAQFCHNARNGQDIVLHTAGETKRDYLYTADAVSALLMILLNGESGEAYNVANSKTYISIRDMAELVALNCAKTPIKVVMEVPADVESFGYAPVVKLNLDTKKIASLGWTPKTDLPQMYKRLLRYLNEMENTDYKP